MPAETNKAPVFTTTYRGELIHVPATIKAVREFLPEGRRQAFTEAAENTPVENLSELLAEWLWDALSDDPEAAETVARVKSGDHVDTTTHEDFMTKRGLSEDTAA
ncbi:hypothetical protein [Streptomyces sp. UNOC14_S4]|uniref:hypothetical protein n=1 Tax=Streptomyces sp. UNOC14_S4 TaxID=2872340 RepID=UPI001E544C26|nr:hypothetical protein [Streptomyces sp. UNOC14_S4]MCC3767807.1 hypothetical protein [Streptomyces sp. UNOC14_S4]